MSSGSTSTTEMKLPKWVEEAGKETYGKAKSFYSEGYQPYTGGERVAGFTPGQQNVFAQTRAYQRPDVTGEVLDLNRRGAAPISSERIVDEGGRLGSIDDYMNPYREQALEPALRRIQQASDIQRKRIGGAATSANAFGDARHGIMESRLNADTSQAYGDTAWNALKQSFDSAMGQRSQDLDRFMTADQTNRQAAFTGAQGLTSAADADQNSFLARMQSLLGIGGLEQQDAQSRLDVPYNDYLMKQQDSYDRLAALVSALGGVPYGRTQVTKENDGGAGLFGALGSLLGAAI